MESVKEHDIDKLFLQMQRELLKEEKTELIELQENLAEFRVNGFSISLPIEFQEAKWAVVKTIFLSKNRPDVILVHSIEPVGFTFQAIDWTGDCMESDLSLIMKQIQETLKLTDGKQVFYDEGQLNNDVPVVWFDYKSFAIDERIYNIMFLFMKEGQLVIGTFYCVFKDYEKWKARVLEILSTIKAGEELNERI